MIDGTIIGEFTETFFYSEDAVAYDKADFLGNFRLTGPSAFGSDYPDADMNVTVVESETANEFYIFGIDYADSVVATFDASASTLSIAPQLLPDFVIDDAVYDMTLYTITTSGSVSGSDAMELTFNMSGDMALTAESAGTGYLIRSEAGGGWVDGYEDIKFTPATTASASARKVKSANGKLSVKHDIVVAEQSATTEKCAKGNFADTGKKISHKTVKAQTAVRIR